MRKNNLVFPIVLIILIFSLITCSTFQQLHIKNQLDSKVRTLFHEISTLDHFQHLINGHQYQYLLSYKSGLQVTLTLKQKNILITKHNSNTSTIMIKPSIQSQLSITQHLIDIKQITQNYVLILFALLSDGYLIQYQYQKTLFIFQLNFNLQIQRKQTKDISFTQVQQNNLMGFDAFLIPLSQIQKNTRTVFNDITQPLQTQSTIIQSRLLIATNYVSLDQDTINQITQFLNKNNSINLISNTKIQNINKIGNTNRYLIDIIVTIKQRQIPYQLIIRNGSNGYEIMGGSYSIDFIPSYQQVINGNQTLNKWMDQLIRTKLQIIMPPQVQLSNIWQDDPYYKLNYTTSNSDYEIQFIVDSMLKKVNITNIIVTQDVIQDTSMINPSIINTNIPLSLDVNSNLNIISAQTDTNSLLYSSPTNIPNAILTPIAISESIDAVNSTISKSFPSQFSIYLTQDCNSQPYNVVHVTHRFRNRVKTATTSNNITNSVDNTKRILNTASIQIDSSQINAQPTSMVMTSSSPSLNNVGSSIQNMIVSPVQITPTLSLQDIIGPSTQLITSTTQSNLSLYDTFNPSLLPINLQVISQIVPYTKSQILSLLAFLQGTVTTVSFNNAKIYIIQKFEYGFRIVFIINSQYVQFIIKSSSINSYTMISMSNTTQQQADSVNQFSSFFLIDLDDQLNALIMKTLAQQNIGLIKSITNIKLRIQADGLYYEIVISTDSGNSYLVIIYYKPEQNFSEVLSYEQISSQYYLTDIDLAKFTESRIDLTVNKQWNLDLLTVLEFVNSNFGQKFNGYGVVYVYKTVITTLNVIRYRIGFKSQSGVYYELIIISLNNSTTPILLKYIKLYDGYGIVIQTHLDTKPVISLFQSMLLLRVMQVNINDYQVQNVLMKQIPLVGKMYKLVIIAKANFQITIFVDLQGIMFIYGIDGIPAYYSVLINLNYPIIGYLPTIISDMRNYLTLQTKTSLQVTPLNNQSTSTQQTIPSSSSTLQSTSTSSTFPNLKFNFSSTIIPTSTLYNAKMDFFCLKSNGTMCISCYYRYYPLNGKCVQVPTPCSTYNNITGQCLSCYTGYYLSNGNCTQMNLLCQQSDSNGNCIQCYNDYTLLNNLCYSTQGIISAKSNNLLISQYDPLCQQYQNKICLKCVASAYLSTKFKSCVIQDPNALQFDTINQVAIVCVRGYVVSVTGTCVKNM